MTTPGGSFSGAESHVCFTQKNVNAEMRRNNTPLQELLGSLRTKQRRVEYGSVWELRHGMGSIHCRSTRRRGWRKETRVEITCMSNEQEPLPTRTHDPWNVLAA